MKRDHPMSTFVPDESVGETPARAPTGYRLVDDDKHLISTRDMVFVAGTRPKWMLARRAGEVGNVFRFTVAQAVATLS